MISNEDFESISKTLGPSYVPFKIRKKTNMRAKFYVTKIIKSGTFTYTDKGVKEEVYGEQLYMSPVCPSKFGDKGEHEDNDFHRYSPSGEFQIQISNPALFGKFSVGQKYYMDFTLSDK